MKELIIKSLTKSYHNTHVLENINLSYSSGTINGIVGINGAGKSTYLNCLGGYTHYKGTIIRKEVNTIGLLSANPYVFPRITGYEFIHFSLSAKKCIEDNEKLNQLNTLFELPLSKFADEYSTGMLKKLHLLVLLLQNNDLLLLDEPFNGLDTLSTAYLVELLLLLKNRDTVIFVSSHDFNQLLKIADTLTYIENRQAFLKSGSLYESGKEIEQRAKNKIQTMFVDKK